MTPTPSLIAGQTPSVITLICTAMQITIMKGDLLDRKENQVSIATLTSKGQTTIPKDVRQRLDLRTGDKLNFTVLGDGSVSMRVKRGDIKELAGLLRRRGPKTVTVGEMNDGIRLAVARKYRRAVKK